MLMSPRHTRPATTKTFLAVIEAGLSHCPPRTEYHQAMPAAASSHPTSLVVLSADTDASSAYAADPTANATSMPFPVFGACGVRRAAVSGLANLEYSYCEHDTGLGVPEHGVTGAPVVVVVASRGIAGTSPRRDELPPARGPTSPTGVALVAISTATPAPTATTSGAPTTATPPATRTAAPTFTTPGRSPVVRSGVP
jgi:hypothetical protein